MANDNALEIVLRRDSPAGRIFAKDYNPRPGLVAGSYAGATAEKERGVRC